MHTTHHMHILRPLCTWVDARGVVASTSKNPRVLGVLGRFGGWHHYFRGRGRQCRALEKEGAPKYRRGLYPPNKQPTTRFSPRRRLAHPNKPAHPHNTPRASVPRYTHLSFLGKRCVPYFKHFVRVIHPGMLLLVNHPVARFRTTSGSGCRNTIPTKPTTASPKIDPAAAKGPLAAPSRVRNPSPSRLQARPMIPVER